ncbi:MAG: hypothetical protein JWO95_1558 [Verrucomicrobiales bacterium]|nr:hypothetical protein [Verrucomicrobiales bacterium]
MKSRLTSVLLVFLCLVLTSNVARAARPLGIDISSFQPDGNINWSQIKSGGVTFCWAKATEGQGLNDSTYTAHMANGKAAGVIMGSYHYAHPELNSAATEASHFWGRAATYTKADGLTLMPMLDVEGSAFSGHVGSTSVSDWCNDWCTDIVADGQGAGSLSLTPIIYVSACNACGFDTTVSQWGADIANYSGNDPQTSNPWTACSSCERWGNSTTGWDFWQYDSTGGITGYSGNIDKDVFNGTSIAAWTVGANTNSTIWYWDPQNTAGANPYTGSMSQTWESNKWSYTSAGLASPVAWVNGKAACFGVHTGIGTPAFTVTMNSSHTVAGFFDGPLTPNACDVTVTGTGTVNLASGAQGMDVKNASDGSLALMRINVNIAGSGQMFPEGNGQLFLHGSNTFSGGLVLGYGDPVKGTNVFTGILNFNNGNALGTGTITLWKQGNGADLKLEGTAAVTVPNDFVIASATTNDIWGNAAGLTLSGDWNMSAALITLGGGTTAANKTILAGTLSGAKGFTIYNPATIILTGTNTYTGTTTITSPAVLQIDGSGKLGSGSYTGAIVDNGTFIYSSTALQTLSGIISGTGPVRVTDAGTLILTGVNTFSGGTIVSNGGTLCVTADSGLGTAAGALTLNGGSLKNNNSAPTITSSRTITLGASGGYFDAGYSGTNAITLSAKLSGSGALLINQDSSPVVLNNVANNYTGNTIIGTNGPGYFSTGTQAWLKLGASAVIPNGSGFGNVIINAAWLGLLDLNGKTQTINGLSGDGTVTSGTGNGTLTIGNNNATSTFNGTIQNGGGTVAIVKTGTGTVTLGGANTYTGTTTINAGTLALASAGSINNTPSITVAAGATLDVSAISSFALSGSTSLNASGTASAATIKGGTVNLGSRPIALTCDGVHPALTISQGTLSLNGNALTVNGAVLADGTYTLIQQTTGNINASGSFTVTGTALGGKPASISVVGGSVLLVLNIAPAITQQPQGSTVSRGDNASFTVTATGTAPLNYQWRFNGSNIPGATATAYTKINAQISDAGSYSVVVSNATSSATSTDAALSISACLISLKNISVSNGINASLTFNVDAGTSYTFQSKDALTDAQWQDLNTLSSGTSTLTVNDIAVTNSQKFYRLTSTCTATRPAGFVALSLLGNSDTFISMPFLRPAASTATIVSAAGNVITVAQDNGLPLAANQFVYVSGSQSNTYYVRFASGALDGMIFPVISNDTNSLTLNLNGNSLSGVVTNDLVFVEPYWTLNSVFPNGTGVNVSPTVGNRNTEILMPDLTTTGINLSAARIYFFNNGLWKQVGQGSVDHGDDTVQPNTPFIVRHNVSTNTSLFAAGNVNAANIAITLNIPPDASSKQDNYIGLMRPVTLTLDDSQLISSGAFVASPVPGSRIDELLVFDHTVAAKNKSSASIYYYWNGAWRRVGAGSTVVGTDPVFTPGTGVILRKGTNTPATWVNTPNY